MKKKNTAKGCGCGCLTWILLLLVIIALFGNSSDQVETESESEPVRSWLVEHENQATESDTLAELVTLPETEELTTEPITTEAESTEEITTAVETETDEPTTEAERTRTYVLNTSRKKIHYLSCPSVPSIKPENYDEWTGHSASEFLESHSNYSACGRCHPY